MVCVAGVAVHRRHEQLPLVSPPAPFSTDPGLVTGASKKMLHLAALVTIRKGNIMHAYYHWKLGEGKRRMAVINAISGEI